MKSGFLLVLSLFFAVSLFGAEIPNVRRNQFTTNATDVPVNVAISNLTAQGTTVFTGTGTNFIFETTVNGWIIGSNSVTHQSFSMDPAGIFYANVFSGNASGLSGYPEVTSSTPGVMDTNTWTIVQTTPGWQVEMERMPYRVQVADTEAGWTNVIQYHKDIGRFGFNIMSAMSGGSVGLYHGSRVNGHVVLNTTNFPSGLGIRDLLHTNGWRWMIWYDRANVAGGATTVAQFTDDIQTIVSWQPDIFWIDEADPYYVGLAAQIVETNTTAIQLVTAVQLSSRSSHIIPRGGHFRLHASTDPTTWAAFLEYSDVVETNYSYYAGMGHPLFIGPEISGVANASAVVQAMWSSDFVEAFCNNSVNVYGRYLIMTNRAVLEVQADPAQVVAKRVLSTNNCWVYLKPAVTPIGPNYYLAVINTNTTTAKSVNFDFKTLVNGLQTSAMLSGFQGGANDGNIHFLVYDMRNSAVVGYQTNINTGSIAASDWTLYKLIASRPLSPVTYSVRPVPSADGGTAWSELSFNTNSGPYNPGGNTYARCGWYTIPDDIKRVNIDVPDYATKVTVSYQIICSGTFSLTNIPSAMRYDPVGGLTTDKDATYINTIADGIQTLTYSTMFLPDTVGQKHIIIDTWHAGASTNHIVLLDTQITVE